MSYTSATLILQTPTIAGGQPRVFTYTTADGDSTIRGSNYFSDGQIRGMRVGDLVDAVYLTTPLYKRYQVSAIQSGGNGATVVTPTAIT